MPSASQLRPAGKEADAIDCAGPPSAATFLSSPCPRFVDVQNTIDRPSGEKVGNARMLFGTSGTASGRAEVSERERTNRRSVTYAIFVPSGEIDANRASGTRPSMAIEKRMTGAGGRASRRSILAAAIASDAPTIADVASAA